MTVGSDRYQTIFVINPGPYKTRYPVIEFQLQSEIHVIDWCGEVSVDSNQNKTFVHADAGLPAGSFYFVTYKSSLTNETPNPKVLCDGKECKNIATFDMDLTLKMLLAINGVCCLITTIGIYLAIKSKMELGAFKDGILSKALEALLNKMNKGGEGDVKEAATAMKEAAAGLSQLAQNIHVQPVTKRANGKQKQRNGPQISNSEPS